MQELSLSKQTFSQLRQANLTYVDKTDQIHKMFLGPKGGVYFLARPRRFGKSLLVDTLDCIFQGKKELFEGLAISKTDYQWPVHPVVRLDFANIARGTPAVFKDDFKRVLYQHAQRYDVDLEGAQELGVIARILFEQLHAKTGKRVVLLIDEYDKPILDHVENPEVAEEMRQSMRAFYEAHKPNEEHLQFTFITGVGRFARASIFSGMNHMVDLTFHPAAATLLGYTQQEVEHYFAHYIAKWQNKFGGRKELLEQIRLWYNGYQCAEGGTRVYNPFSFMTFLDTGNLENYWFGSGTPQFLIKQMAKNSNWQRVALKDIRLTSDLMSLGNLDTLPINALLYQAGYLTIKQVELEDGTTWYHLDYPNREVESSMRPCILAAMVNVPQAEGSELMYAMSEALRTADIDHFLRIMQSFYARVTYQLQVYRKESYYHVIFAAACFQLRFKTQIEEQTNAGRMDAVITTDNHVIIFEFKLDKPAQEALEQIKTQNYAQRFAPQGKPVILVGVSFSSKERNITDWVSEVVV